MEIEIGVQIECDASATGLCRRR